MKLRERKTILSLNMRRYINKFVYEKLNDENFKHAIYLWFYDEKECLNRFGHISNWNTSRITNKEVNAIKGKTVQHRTKIIPEQEVDKYNNKSLRLIIDIMFVNNDPYLISVSDHLNLVMVNDLKSYSENNPIFANSINNVITQIIMRYRAESFFIYEVISDNDTCFKLLSNAINQLNNKL